MFPCTAVSAADAADPHSRLTVHSDVIGAIGSLELNGVITRSTYAPVVDAVRSVLAAGCTEVRLDLSSVHGLDARAVAALAVVARMATDSGAHLLIENPSPFATRILEIGGLAQLCDRAVAADPA